MQFIIAVAAVQVIIGGVGALCSPSGITVQRVVAGSAIQQIVAPSPNERIVSDPPPCPVLIGHCLG